MKVQGVPVSPSNRQMIEDYIDLGLTHIQVSNAIEKSVICYPTGDGGFDFAIAWGGVKYNLDRMLPTSSSPDPQASEAAPALPTAAARSTWSWLRRLVE